MKKELKLVHDDEIVIDKTWYEQVKADIAWLDALEAAGVDNWEGFSEAVRIFYEVNPEYAEEL